MLPPVTSRILALLQRRGVVRPRDLTALGVSPNNLWRLERAGLIERVGRGLYIRMDGATSEKHTLVEAAARVPHGVICLLSALRFHELTTQNPHEVWLAIDVRARAPREPRLPLRIVRFSGAALTEGVETHCLEGV